jgi:hypothetical protein
VLFQGLRRLHQCQQTDQQARAAAVAAATPLKPQQQLTAMQHRQRQKAANPNKSELQNLAAAMAAGRAAAVA